MTLTAAYMIGKVPALLSDMLSTGFSDDEHQPIATRADLNEPLPLEWGHNVNGLYRKSVKFGQNAAVAGSGSGFGLSLILRELEKIAPEQMITADFLFDRLSRLDTVTSSKTACFLVGWIVDDQGPQSFKWDTTTPEIIEWGDDYVTGSGANFFQQNAWLKTQRSWDHIQGFDQAQHYALMQISCLLVNEISNGLPIQYLFGGGYDLLLWDGSSFRQAADITFLFFSLDLLQADSKDVGNSAPILIRQAELEDCLVVRAIIPENLLGVTSDKGERVAIIAPITLLNKEHTFQCTHEPSEVPHFADRIFVNITGLGPSGKPEHWSAGVQGAEAELFCLDADQENGKVRFYLPREIMGNMQKAAAEHLGAGESLQPRRH